MQKLLKYIILFGIFTLPLINSRITELLWFSFSMPVSWNYEFTKVMFFNIWSSLVISLFFINSLVSLHLASPKGRGIIGIFFFYIILLASTIFSESPIVSFLLNSDKSHSFLMWSNLVWLFIVFSSLFQPSPNLSQKERDNNKNFFNQIIKTFILSWIFVSLIWLKEYFFPTFNYWDLWNRLFSTFGHPNYVSIFLLALIPFLYYNLSPFFKGSTFFWSMKKKGRDYWLLFTILLFIITLILTKSFIAIFLFIVFIIIKGLKPSVNKFKNNKKILLTSQHRALALCIFLTILFTLIYIFLPEKLHSFISRYFLWEATIRIIFSDIKLFLFWWGLETLTYFFDNFKSEYVYIFENLWYTADRPHNIILNFFYHFWIFWLIFILVIYYKVFIKTNILSTEGFSPLQKTGQAQGIAPTEISLILIFIFLLFNPTNIIIYLLIIILLAKNYLPDNTFLLSKRKYPQGDRVMNIILLMFMVFISIFWAYNSIKFYISETYSYKNNFTKALKIYKYNSNNYFLTLDFEKWLDISKIKTLEYYMYKLQVIPLTSKEGLVLVSEFLEKYNYAENYFFVWDLLWNIKEEEKAKIFYQKWLEKLPDLWNKKSKYYEGFLVKKLKINWNRYLSEKYWLKKILDRIDYKFIETES